MSNERKVKGLLGTKLGMTQTWDDNNKVVPVTVIQAGPCVVTQVRSPEKDGYSAVQLAFGAVKPTKVTKPAAGHFDAAGVTPRKHLVELRTADAAEYTLGQELLADVFAAADVVHDGRLLGVNLCLLCVKGCFGCVVDSGSLCLRDCLIELGLACVELRLTGVEFGLARFELGKASVNLGLALVESANSLLKL